MFSSYLHYQHIGITRQKCRLDLIECSGDRKRFPETIYVRSVKGKTENAPSVRLTKSKMSIYIYVSKLKPSNIGFGWIGRDALIIEFNADWTNIEIYVAKESRNIVKGLYMQALDRRLREQMYKVRKKKKTIIKTSHDRHGKYSAPGTNGLF